MPEYLLPDAGEGLTEADIVEWHVGEGDHVDVNDPLVDIETAKSIVELPSPFAGTVTGILAEPGTTVAVGAPIISIDDGSAPAPGQPPRREGAPAGKATGEALAVAPAPPRHPLLVGYGPAEEKPAGPASRRRRDHRVGVHKVPDGRAGDEFVVVDAVRRLTARNVLDSRLTKVHTTTFVSCDVSETKELVDRLRARREFAGLHVTPLLVWCKAICLAMRRNPMLNASWATGAERIVLHRDVNIGIAADTPRGLMVPVIRHAQERDLVGMAEELTRLVELARQGSLQPGDYGGGTFTVTNIGGLGLGAGTPIINGAESAILAMGAIARRPWVVGSGENERIQPRWVTTMSLSFDHRLIDGAVAARFLGDLEALVGDPALAMAY